MNLDAVSRAVLIVERYGLNLKRTLKDEAGELVFLQKRPNPEDRLGPFGSSSALITNDPPHLKHATGRKEKVRTDKLNGS